MEIGGLMAHAFRIFLGNPDVMIITIVWMVFSTMLLTIFEVKKETEI